MKKLFTFAALTICLVGCGSDVPTIENECNPANPSLYGFLYKTLNECKDKYIAKLKMDNVILSNKHDESNLYQLENEKLKHEIEILKIRIGYECKNMDVK